MAIGKSQLVLRIFLWTILFCFVGFFVYKGAVPCGRIVYSYDFEKNNRFFSDLRPSDRVDDRTNGVQNILGDPVYFSVYTPRRFDKAKLMIKYKTNNIPPVVEAGVMIDKENWRYDLKPICNKVLNQLSLAWEDVGGEGIVLLQKNKKYNSVEEFLGDLPNNEKIAVYHYALSPDYTIDDYEKLDSDKENDIPVSFVGSWQSLLYLKNEDLAIDFEFFYLEDGAVGQEINVMLFYDETLIISEHLDGKENEKGLQGISLSALNLPEGVYRLELRASDKVVTSKIKLKHKKIVFFSELNIPNEENSGFKIFTDSKNVQITIIDPKNLQEVYMNDKKFEINETYKQFEVKTEKASTTVQYASLSFENGGFSLSGDGVFAFSESSFFNPRIKKLDRNVDIMGDGIEYVVAEYNFPAEDDSWMISNVEFDLNSAYREEGEYEFMISIPGMRADDDVKDFLIIDEMKIEFFGKNLWERFLEIIKR